MGNPVSVNDNKAPRTSCLYLTPFLFFLCSLSADKNFPKFQTQCSIHLASLESSLTNIVDDKKNITLETTEKKDEYSDEDLEADLEKEKKVI